MKLLHHKDTHGEGAEWQACHLPLPGLLLSVFHDYTVTSVEMHTPLALKSLHLASEKDWRANPRLSAKLEDKVTLECLSAVRAVRGWKSTP